MMLRPKIGTQPLHVVQGLYNVKAYVTQITFSVCACLPFGEEVDRSVSGSSEKLIFGAGATKGSTS